MKMTTWRVTVTIAMIVAAGGILTLTYWTNQDPRTIPWLPTASTASPWAFGITQGLIAAAVATIGTLSIAFAPRRQWLVAAALTVIVTPLAIGGFAWAEGQWGISDWDYYFSYHESLRRTVLEYHQLPLWNPYICGGTAALGEPESPLFTPTFLLELALGVPVGLKAAIFLATAVGALGMLALGKHTGLAPAPAYLSALVFAFGTVNLLEIVEGHPNIFAAMYVPWIFWAWLGAYRQPTRRRYVGCGLLLAVTFFQGGIYLLMYTALAFILLPWFTASPRRAYLTTLYSGLWALGFASIKLLPVLWWLREFQDEAYASSAATWQSLPQILLGRYPHGVEEVIPQQGGGWHEYGAYLGPVALLLAILGAVTTRSRRLRWGLVMAAAFSLLLSSTGPLLKPFFDSAPYLPRSNISRFILFAVLPLALLAGQGMQSLVSRRRWLAPVVVALVAFDLFTLTYPVSEQAFILPAVRPLPSPAPSPLAHSIQDHRIRVAGIDYTRAYAASLAGYGTLTYCSTLGPTPAIQAIEAKEETDYVNLHQESGTAILQAWSPNRLKVLVEATEPNELDPAARPQGIRASAMLAESAPPILSDTPGIPAASGGVFTGRNKIVINQNFARGWRVNGQPALNENGRLAATVGSGTTELVFAYRPPGLSVGTLLTVLTLILATITAWSRRNGKVR